MLKYDKSRVQTDSKYKPTDLLIYVMNQLDPIKKLYNMYSEEENTPRIVEVEDNKLGFDSDLKNGLVDPYLKL